MLGQIIDDPSGSRGSRRAQGLGLLDVATVISGEKRLQPVQGVTTDHIPFTGYEMHMGITQGVDRARPFARLADGSPEGPCRPMVAYRHLYSRAVRRRSAAFGLVGTPRRPVPDRL